MTALSHLMSIPGIALDSKIVTSSRNGELSLWDLNRSGTLKFGTSDVKMVQRKGD